MAQASQSNKKQEPSSFPYNRFRAYKAFRGIALRLLSLEGGP